MKSTREKILQTLLTYPQSTISEIANAVKINTISVRHHLSNLQADGLVIDEEERHGVGRPRLVYSLTEKGLEYFPTNYLKLSDRLIGQIKATLPEATVNQLFTRMGTDLAESYTQKAKSLRTMDDRLNLLSNLLEEEGFTVRWEKNEDGYQIHEISCPYYHIGQTHPEICLIDRALIAGLLSIPVEKTSCMLDGNSLCTYNIKAEDVASK